LEKKLSQNQAKPKNRAKPEKPIQTGFCPKKRTETSRFEPVSVLFLKKIRFGYFFFIKTESN
jgi:hypothetical protein